ncbi:TPA: hypothetical protein RUX32_000231 [Aeromonas dhakensis]|nr:hypothetical protein [Aeromonas dhakensis]
MVELIQPVLAGVLGKHYFLGLLTQCISWLKIFYNCTHHSLASVSFDIEMTLSSKILAMANGGVLIIGQPAAASSNTRRESMVVD